MKQVFQQYLVPLFVSALSGAWPAAAQFYDLATDFRGARLLFSTPLSLPDRERNDQFKLVEAYPNGSLRTWASVPLEMQTPGGFFPSNFPSLRGAMLSSDGTVTAYTASRWCLGGSRCVSVERVLGTVLSEGCRTGGSCALQSAGTVSLSANGRWAVFVNPASMQHPYGVMRLDLPGGAAESSAQYLPGAVAAGARFVAGDGTVVSGSPERFLEVRRRGFEPVRIPVSVGLDSVTVSSDARFAVGTTRDQAQSLVAVELDSGLETVLVEAEEGCSHPVLSDDGTRLLFLSGANWEGRNDALAVQVWTIETLTGALRQWTSEPAGIVDATLSGDGQTVWAATGDGRIVRIHAAGMEAEVIVPASPGASLRRATRIAPGSRYELEGRGLAGARLQWQGLPLPVLDSTNERVRFLLPFTAAAGRGVIEISREGSPFLPLHIEAEAVEAAPLFAQTDHYVWGLRQDGSPLTMDNPAAPGETVTLMAMGLGPVSASGQVLLPLELRASESPAAPAQMLAVLEAGMDPGMEGMYLIRCRLPSSFSTAALQLGIRVAGADHDDDWAWLPARMP